MLKSEHSIHSWSQWDHKRAENHPGKNLDKETITLDSNTHFMWRRKQTDSMKLRTILCCESIMMVLLKYNISLIARVDIYNCFDVY